MQIVDAELATVDQARAYHIEDDGFTTTMVFGPVVPHVFGHVHEFDPEGELNG